MINKIKKLNHVRSMVMRLAHNLKKSGFTMSEALSCAWHYAKHEWRWVSFEKKNGQSAERLVYLETYNKQAVRGGVRTCPPAYTLHIEVQNGMGDTLNDFHPLTAKWLACQGQTYTTTI